MKIAIITSGFLPVIDGVTVSGFYRLQKLSKGEHQVLLFCPDYRELESIYPNWREYTGEILPGVRVVNLKSQPFFVDFERNVARSSYKTVLQELEQFQPDIIHVDEPERLFVGLWRVAGVDFAKRKGIPCLSFFRTNFLEYLEDFFPLPGWAIAILQFLVKKLIVYVYNSYDVTLVASKVTLPKVTNLGINNAIYGNFLGLDGSNFNPKLRQENFFAQTYNLPQVDRQVKLIFLGRLTPDKGWDFTLDAFPAVFRAIDPARLAILIAGDGESKEEIITRLSNLTPHVHLLGRVLPENVPALMANSDIHVTTSEKETRGLTVLEAFAAGIPVLAPRAGGVVENIEEGINGFLFNPQDISDFTNKLKILVENQALRHEMGKKGRELVISEYTWEQTIQNLVAIWQERINQISRKTKSKIDCKD